MRRPIGITILAILGALAALLAIIRCLQMLGIFPVFFGGSVQFFSFTLVGGILWGLLAVALIWIVVMLWRMDPLGWGLILALAGFSLGYDLVSLFGGSTFLDILPSLIINGLIVIYCLLPGTRQAFEIS